MRNDDAYANMPHIPGGADYPDRWAVEARQWRELQTALGRARLNQSYGEASREKYDLFYPRSRPEGLVVLIHGGFWLKFGREDFSHLARGVTEAGWACAMPSYPLAPDVRIHEITRAMAAATTAAAQLIAGPIALTGHSAGGHLAARLLCADVDLPVRDRISACVPVSPLSDLAPLIETTMNAQLKIDAAEALAESPVYHRPAIDVPVTVVVGAAERPAFIDQARWLTEAWPGASLDLHEGRHHFDVIEAYEDPASSLVAALTGATA